MDYVSPEEEEEEEIKIKNVVSLASVLDASADPDTLIDFLLNNSVSKSVGDTSYVEVLDSDTETTQIASAKGSPSGDSDVNEVSPSYEELLEENSRLRSQYAAVGIILHTRQPPMLIPLMTTVYATDVTKRS